MARLTNETIRKELLESGFNWKSGEYKNLDSSLTLECTEGHEFLSSFRKIRKRQQCPTCLQEENCCKEEVKIAEIPKKKGRRILGLDNATNKTGYAIFENGELLTYGVKIAEGDGLIQRIANLRHWLLSIIDIYEIDAVGLENIQLQQNPQTFMILAKLLGVLENTVWGSLHSEPYIVSSSTWKSYAGIKGKTRQQHKQQSQQRIEKKYKIKVSQDAADAINLAEYVEKQDKLDSSPMIYF